VRRTLGWAEDAARQEDYSTALSWLATIEAVEGELSDGVEARRRQRAHRMKTGGPTRAEH
jgi:hypothetical protein